ncbi:MAG: hypothetical protein GWN32_07425 [Gemmatimonadetes bacterium]|nr:hypothetical protein [Gemmatimonadota bacterium]
MKIRRVTRAALAILACAAIVGSGCSDGSTEPGPEAGRLTVSVSSSGGGAAAFLVTVTGDGITNAGPANSSHQAYSVLAGNTLTAAIVLSNPLSNGGILEFDVPDVNAASSYDVDLVQAAGADNALLSTSDFTVQLTN